MVHIWRLRFGQYFEAEVWSRFWGWSLVEILWLKIGQHFELKVWSRLGSWSLVEIQKLNFGQFVTCEAVILVKARHPGLFCCGFGFLYCPSSTSHEESKWFPKHTFLKAWFIFQESESIAKLDRDFLNFWIGLPTPGNSDHVCFANSERSNISFHDNNRNNIMIWQEQHNANTRTT